LASAGYLFFESAYDQLRSADLAQLAAYAGQTLRQLHSLPAPTGAPIHPAAAEIQVLNKWLQQLGWLAPAATQALAPYYAQVCAGLQASSLSPALLHRDFYDKQLFVTAQGTTGLLDFDLLAVGEAALDVANALVHFELRALQGYYDLVTAERAIEAFLLAYASSATVWQRVQAYADATRLQLACVYGCRPYSMDYVPALVARIGWPRAQPYRHRQNA